ncbi:MAG: PTS fructose transporter subunit IIA [Gammaproteobacteria bacterium]|jgi:PTS system mannose-specific IIA component
MSVGLLIITHNLLGEDLLSTARNMLGRCPLKTRTLAISLNCDPERQHQRAQEYCQEVDEGDGVLVLTDMFGSTPSNIASRLCNENVRVIAGLSLPMLVRIFNYPDLDLDALAAKAISGGHDGVVICSQT